MRETRASLIHQHGGRERSARDIKNGEQSACEKGNERGRTEKKGRTKDQVKRGLAAFVK